MKARKMSEQPAGSPIPDYGWNDTQAESSHDYLQPAILRALESISTEGGQRSKSLRIFDAGCGNGALLHRLLREGHTLAGCDASETGVSQARRLCGGTARVERVSVYEDLAALFGSNWDVVIATEVIEHLYAPRDFVRQARKLLVPGGHVVLTTPYHGYWKNLLMAITGTLDAHFTALWDGGHIKFWSYRTLRTLLSEFNFSRFEFYGAGRLPWIWKSMVVVARMDG